MNCQVPTAVMYVDMRPGIVRGCGPDPDDVSIELYPEFEEFPSRYQDVLRRLLLDGESEVCGQCEKASVGLTLWGEDDESDMWHDTVVLPSTLAEEGELMTICYGCAIERGLSLT